MGENCPFSKSSRIMRQIRFEYGPAVWGQSFEEIRDQKIMMAAILEDL